MLKALLQIFESIPHRKYIEVFGGGAVVLLNKPRVEFECYNDIDSGLYNFFSVIADPVKFPDFKRRVEALPYSRELYNTCRVGWENESDEIERAAKWFVAARQSFSGKFGASWSSATNAVWRNMALKNATWLSALDKLPEIHSRLVTVQIENSDWRDILKRYDSLDALFYLDPPYIHDTRRSGKYVHEMTDDDHAELVRRILELRGAVVLSGYHHEIYAPLENAGWLTIDKDRPCCSVGRTKAAGLLGKGACDKNQRRTETVWVKPTNNVGLFSSEVK